MTALPDDFGADLISMIIDEITYGQPLDAETDLLLTELVDSLGVVRIVAWLEAQLGIEIDPADVVIENFRSVGHMLRYLEGR